MGTRAQENQFSACKFMSDCLFVTQLQIFTLCVTRTEHKQIIVFDIGGWCKKQFKSPQDWFIYDILAERTNLFYFVELFSINVISCMKKNAFQKVSWGKLPCLVDDNENLTTALQLRCPTPLFTGVHYRL